QVDMFEYLILNVTVACDLLFSWIENSATNTSKITENIIKEAVDDKLGVMLAFDG
ncbi:10119_t:CDS:2, partial [Funneliformis caledonium]